jgi:hypothetical protein
MICGAKFADWLNTGNAVRESVSVCLAYLHVQENCPQSQINGV